MITVRPTTAEWVMERFAIEKVTVERSVEIWAVRNDETLVYVAGVIKDSMIGTARMWLILCEGFKEQKMSNLRACRALVAEARRRYPGLIAFVNPGRDLKFAEFTGFEPISWDYDLVRVA